MTSIIGLVLIMALGTWSLWKFESKALSYLAGFAFVIYGFNYWTTSHYMSVLLVLVGGFFFIKGKLA